MFRAIQLWRSNGHSLWESEKYGTVTQETRKRRGLVVTVLKHLSPDPVDVSEGNCGYSTELFTISG